MLARARRGGRPHPTVALLAEAGVLALRLVGAGRFEPGDGRWLPSALDPDEDARVRRLAAEAAYDGWPAAAAEAAVRDLVAAVVDALPRGTPTARRARRGVPPAPRRRAGQAARPQRRGQPARAGHRSRCASRPTRRSWSRARCGWCSRSTTSSTRSTCATRRCCGPARPEDHGFGERARTHAAIALRAAAHAWPVLDRLLELRVPDEITLDTDELVSLLDDGVAALRRVGVDVLWPRSLGRDLTTRATLEHRDERPQDNPLMTGLFGPEAMFAFKWQVALHGEPAQRRRDAPAGERGEPGPQAARRLDRRRPGRSRARPRSG